jgi:hypothetical protein
MPFRTSPARKRRGSASAALDDELYRRDAAREFDGTILVGRDGMEI